MYFDPQVIGGFQQLAQSIISKKKDEKQQTQGMWDSLMKLSSSQDPTGKQTMNIMNLYSQDPSKNGFQNALKSLQSNNYNPYTTQLNQLGEAGVNLNPEQKLQAFTGIKPIQPMGLDDFNKNFTAGQLVNSTDPSMQKAGVSLGVSKIQNQMIPQDPDTSMVTAPIIKPTPVATGQQTGFDISNDFKQQIQDRLQTGLDQQIQKTRYQFGLDPTPAFDLKQTIGQAQVDKLEADTKRIAEMASSGGNWNMNVTHAFSMLKSEWASGKIGTKTIFDDKGNPITININPNKPPTVKDAEDLARRLAGGNPAQQQGTGQPSIPKDTNEMTDDEAKAGMKALGYKDDQIKKGLDAGWTPQEMLTQIQMRKK